MHLESFYYTMQDIATKFGIKLIAALAIYIVGKIVVGIILKVLSRLLSKSKLDETIRTFITHLVKIALMIFILLAVLGQLGVETTSFVAIIGAASFAVGLALQGALANFAAGVLLMLFKPFKVGDLVEVAGITGVVQAISVLITEFSTPDNKKIIVPNSKVMAGTITNYTTNGTLRVDLVIGVGYDDNLDKVRKVLIDEVGKNEKVLKDPALTIAVESLGDSSVNFAVRPWVNVADYWDVRFGLLENIKKRFDQEGISIPYPQQDVHHHNQENAA